MAFTQTIRRAEGANSMTTVAALPMGSIPAAKIPNNSEILVKGTFIGWNVAEQLGVAREVHGKFTKTGGVLSFAGTPDVVSDTDDGALIGPLTFSVGDGNLTMYATVTETTSAHGAGWIEAFIFTYI